jgi:D-xylose 1-dehydrogenase (NADP+, D-xylono-1,5-lactone-forming)
MHTPPQIRWAVLGCGQIAVDKSLHGVLAAKGAQLVAIADLLEPRRELALALAEKNGQRPKAYVDYREALADPEVQAVYISLPTGMHKQAVIDAANAKKAILCEKPLGNSSLEVREMVRAARANGVPLMTAYMARFSDVFQKTRELIASGAIGKVTFVTAHFSYPCNKYYPPGAPGGWRYTDTEGGGPLLDIGVYLAFGIREMLGERITAVSPLNCDTDAPVGSNVPDTTAACFVTDKGTPGTLVTTFSHVALYMNFYGTKGNITVNDCFYQTSGARLECKHEDGDVFVLDTKSDPELAHFDNYRREFEHFSECLLTNTQHSPSEDDVMSDALLLDALKQNCAAITVPAPADFLE